MGHHEGLKALADDELLAGLSSIVRRNQVTGEFLAYLAELDERQLFLDLGYASLFEYCAVALGLCESTAGRHIAAARVGRNQPQAFAMVACGELHASALSLMKKSVTSDNALGLFELCKGKSARRVEELLAARFPRPDVRDLIRRLPVPDVTPHVESATHVESAAFPAEKSDKEGAAVQGNSPLTNAAPDMPKERRLEPLSADRYGVHFTADGEFRDLLERVRGLAGHRLPSGDLLTLMKRGLEAYERELERDRFALGRKPRAYARESARVERPVR